MTQKLGETFNERLRFLETLATAKYSGTPAADQYAEWVRDAHAVRGLRNDLFHGRWGFIPREGMVANVVGLPTSPKQTETRYSIGQLRDALQSMRLLRSRLEKLRRTWPV